MVWFGGKHSCYSYNIAIGAVKVECILPQSWCGLGFAGKGRFLTRLPSSKNDGWSYKTCHTGHRGTSLCKHWPNVFVACPAIHTKLMEIIMLLFLLCFCLHYA